jgi:hypothetical protein
VAFWYILCLIGIYFPVLACCTKKNLATLVNGMNGCASVFQILITLKQSPRTLFEVEWVQQQR